MAKTPQLLLESRHLHHPGHIPPGCHRNFQSVIESARTACFNSGQRVDDHFVEVTEMVEIGSGAQRRLKTVMMSRYACYLVIQNADPSSMPCTLRVRQDVSFGWDFF